MNKYPDTPSIRTRPGKRDKSTADGRNEQAHASAESIRDKNPDEADLVERARAGDHDAFRTLFQRYHRRAYALALGVLHNTEDALDVVQDAFIKAHRYLDRFEGASAFYTWLYRIVMNRSIDLIRQRRRAQHVDFAETFAHEDDDTAIDDDGLMPRILGQNPSKALVRKEMRAHIRVALAELSDNHRAVLIMRELEGMSYSEMADAMQCSKGTIMSRLFHARKNMQKRLLEFMDGQKDLEA